MYGSDTTKSSLACLQLCLGLGAKYSNVFFHKSGEEKSSSLFVVCCLIDEHGEKGSVLVQGLISYKTGHIKRDCFSGKRLKHRVPVLNCISGQKFRFSLQIGMNKSAESTFGITGVVDLSHALSDGKFDLNFGDRGVILVLDVSVMKLDVVKRIRKDRLCFFINICSNGAVCNRADFNCHPTSPNRRQKRGIVLRPKGCANLRVYVLLEICCYFARKRVVFVEAKQNATVCSGVVKIKHHIRGR
mmetsp:Transcript_10878/g.19206  ORF Transcript_10878/g.19206 Transcript_10878/m.19206 type:complete len:244 (-) Transcript_10878:462-1193(-)